MILLTGFHTQVSKEYNGNGFMYHIGGDGISIRLYNSNSIDFCFYDDNLQQNKYAGKGDSFYNNYHEKHSCLY